MVVINHSGHSAEAFIGKSPGWLKYIYDRGYLGVDFFFVLSGFLIFYNSFGAKPSLGWVWRFIESRLIRIYIPYLPITIGLGLAYTLLPSLSAGTHLWSWFASISLAPTSQSTALSVAWTLRHEIVFYGLFTIFFWIGRPVVLTAIWAAGCLVLYILFGKTGGPHSYQMGLIDIEFFFGVLAARFILSSIAINDWAILIFSFVIMGLFLFFFDRPGSAVFALSMALMLIFFVRRECNSSMIVPKSLVFLGNASYSIYLVHAPLISLLSRVGRHTVLREAPMAMVMIDVAVAVVVGSLFHLAFERPAVDFARDMIGKRAMFGGSFDPPIRDR